jgi:acyl-coenzyme A thioesterase PaaI-like protein
MPHFRGGRVTEPASAVQDHYPDDFAHCYGCGRLNQHGLHIRTIMEGDEAVLRFTPRTHHIAVPGFVYGGLIASLIDCHSIGAAAAHALHREGRTVGDGPAPRYVTGMLKVDYVAPTPLGPVLEVRARVTHATERKATVESTLSAGGKITARGEVVAVRMPESMVRG